MAIRTLRLALAAAAMTAGAGAQAAAPVRSSAPIQSERLFGGGEFLPFAVFLAAVLAVAIILGSDDNNDVPHSP